MLTDLTITGEEVTKQLGVPISTLYRHLPGGRSALVAELSNGRIGLNPITSFVPEADR